MIPYYGSSIPLAPFDSFESEVGVVYRLGEENDTWQSDKDEKVRDCYTMTRERRGRCVVVESREFKAKEEGSAFGVMVIGLKSNSDRLI